VIGWLGYGLGEHAPGRTSIADAVAAAHHVLLSHGLAADVLRRESPGSQVGITVDLLPTYPASEAPEDVAAARELDGERNRWFLDPLFRAEYPADVLELLAPVAPPVRDGDLEAIAAPLDFVGVNYYQRQIVARAADGGRRIVYQEGSTYTEMGWEVSPGGLFDLLVRLRDEYATPPIYITENGAAFSDVRVHDGSIRDPERQAYISAHIEAIGRALEAGVPVGGYFLWTFLDNFEWSQGYSKRFGIVYVDYPTLQRIPKSSFYWYRDFLAGVTRPRLPSAVP
jgi:beta-glucosidase